MVLATRAAVLVICIAVLNDTKSCVSDMTVVLATRAAVLVICIAVLNDTKSCVSDMTAVLVIRRVIFFYAQLRNRAEQ